MRNARLSHPPVAPGLSSEKEHADLDVGELAGVAQDEVAGHAAGRSCELARTPTTWRTALPWLRCSSAERAMEPSSTVWA
jgi:hypothetical protein